MALFCVLTLTQSSKQSPEVDSVQVEGKCTGIKVTLGRARVVEGSVAPGFVFPPAVLYFFVASS